DPYPVQRDSTRNQTDKRRMTSGEEGQSVVVGLWSLANNGVRRGSVQLGEWRCGVCLIRKNLPSLARPGRVRDPSPHGLYPSPPACGRPAWSVPAIFSEK